MQRLKYSVSADEQSADSTPHADRKYERQRLKYERLTKVRSPTLEFPQSAPLAQLTVRRELSTVRGWRL